MRLKLADRDGFEPPKCQDQNLVPYHLANGLKKLLGGRCAIRTHGAVSDHGLASRCNSPLCQSSKYFRLRVPGPLNLCGRFPRCIFAGAALLFLDAGERIERSVQWLMRPRRLPAGFPRKLEFRMGFDPICSA